MTAKYLKKLDIDYFQVLNDDQVLVVYKSGYRKVITGKIKLGQLKIKKEEMLL